MLLTICKFCNFRGQNASKATTESHIVGRKHKKNIPTKLFIEGFPAGTDHDKIVQFFKDIEANACIDFLKVENGECEKVQCIFENPSTTFKVVHEPLVFEKHQLQVTFLNKITQKSDFVELLQKEKTFDQQLKVLQNTLQPDRQLIVAKCRQICAKLREIFVSSKKWPQIKIFLFGSIATGLHTTESDIDLYVDVGIRTDRNFTICELNNLMSIRFCLQRSGQFSNIFLIQNAKVPIIKFVDIATKIKCDLSIRSRLGVQNSRLITVYLCLDSKLRQIMMAIKFWYTSMGVLEPHLTAYALTMMFIFYLQQPPYNAPAVHSLQNASNSLMQEGWNCGFSHENNLRNDTLASSSGAEIFYGFFEFYANFDFAKKAICPFYGKALDREDFIEPDKLPDVYSHYKALFGCNSAKYKKGLSLNSGIFIQDPFQHSRNVAERTGTKQAEEFYSACYSVKKYFNTGCLYHYILRNVNPKIVYCICPQIPEGFTEFITKVINKNDPDSINEQWYLEARKLALKVLQDIMLCKVTTVKVDESSLSSEYRVETTIDMPKALSFSLNFDKDIQQVKSVTKVPRAKYVRFFNFDIKLLFKRTLFIHIYKNTEEQEPTLIRKIAEYLEKLLRKPNGLIEIQKNYPHIENSDENKIEVVESVRKAKKPRKTPLYKVGFVGPKPIDIIEKPEIELTTNTETQQIISDNKQEDDKNNEDDAMEMSEEDEVSEVVGEKEKEIEIIEIEDEPETNEHSDENANGNINDEGKGQDEEEEDVPPDFFDDFSNQDFMDGLDIVDEDEPDEDSQEATSNSAQKPEKEKVPAFSKQSKSKEKLKSSSTKRRKIEEKKRRSSSRGRRMSRSSRSPYGDRRRRELRRDPEKTRRDIHRDKVRKEQKIVTDKLKIVETGLVPPGTEMDIDTDSLSKLSTRKNDAKSLSKPLSRKKSPVEMRKRSRSSERKLRSSERNRRSSERNRRSSMERRRQRSVSRERRRYSRSPEAHRRKERKRRSSSIQSIDSEREAWLKKKKRSRSKESPLSRKRKRDIAKKKSFLEEIKEKLKEIGNPIPTYYPPVVPIHTVTPVPVPAPQYYSQQSRQYDQNFFIGENYHQGAQYPNPVPAPPPPPPPAPPAPAPIYISPAPVPYIEKPAEMFKNPSPPPSESPSISMPVSSLQKEAEEKKREREKEVNFVDVSNADKLFAEKKISLSDFLSITAKPEVHSSSPDHLQKKIRVISRCQEALKALSDEKRFNGRLCIRAINRQEKPKEDTKYQSPLRRIPIVRFQYTTPLKTNEVSNPFGAALDRLLKSCGLLRELPILVDDDDSASQQQSSAYADEDPLPKIVEAAAGPTAADKLTACEECKRRKALVFADVGTQCATEQKLTFSVSTQVSEDDLNQQKKTSSLASLTPAQLLGKVKEDDNNKKEEETKTKTTKSPIKAPERRGAIPDTERRPFRAPAGSARPFQQGYPYNDRPRFPEVFRDFRDFQQPRPLFEPPHQQVPFFDLSPYDPRHPNNRFGGFRF